jgi:hypothetical protein
MVAYSVETIFLNSGSCIARRAILARSRALLYCPPCVEADRILEVGVLQPRCPRFLVHLLDEAVHASFAADLFDHGAYAASSLEKIRVAINSSLTLRVSPGRRPTLL